MPDGDVDDGYFDNIHSLGDAHDPVVATDRHQAKRHGFIEGFRRDFHSVLYTVHIFYGDAAGADRHKGKNLAYSLFVRHSKSSYYPIQEALGAGVRKLNGRLPVDVGLLVNGAIFDGDVDLRFHGLSID